LKSLILIACAATALVGLPFDLRAEPPKGLPPLTLYAAPAFPEGLRLTSVTDGYATVIMTLREDGSVDDVVALEASHPAFVESVLKAVRQWRFDTAQPIQEAAASRPRREVIQFDFRRTGTIDSVSQRDATKAFFPQRPAAGELPLRTVDWEQLDVPPQRIAVVQPKVPQGLRTTDKGYASLSFVIDADGNVRVPAVAQSSHAEFGAAAVAAVKQWRFAPPRQGDTAIQVWATRSFSFGAKERT
jgi:TonB family protein